jgi:hypothetical protein
MRRYVYPHLRVARLPRDRGSTISRRLTDRDQSAVSTPLALAAAAWPRRVALALSPPALLGAFCFLQIFENYQSNTPVGSLTVGLGAMFLLLYLLLIHPASRFSEGFGGSRPLRIALSFLLIWVATFTLTVSYSPLGEAARATITAAGFVAVVVIGAGFAGVRSAIKGAALGAAAGLLTLGLLGILVSQGLIRAPERVTAARDFFGVTMPFERSYGLDVGYDTTAYLACLPVAYCAVHLKRLRYATLLVVLAFVFTAVFQARGMMIQVLIALLAVLVMRPHFRTWVGVPVLLVLMTLATLAVGDLLTTDETSSEIRATQADATIHDATHDPLSFVGGRDQGGYFVSSVWDREPHLGPIVSSLGTDNALHNLFLGSLVGRGWLSFLALVGVFAVVLWTAFQRWRSQPDDSISQVLLLAAVLVTVEALIEPSAANIAGLWLVMGFVLGRPKPPDPAGPVLPSPAADVSARQEQVKPRTAHLEQSPTDPMTQ